MTFTFTLGHFAVFHHEKEKPSFATVPFVFSVPKRSSDEKRCIFPSDHEKGAQKTSVPAEDARKQDTTVGHCGVSIRNNPNFPCPAGLWLILHIVDAGNE